MKRQKTAISDEMENWKIEDLKGKKESLEQLKLPV